jgi:hypothetical protein
MRDVEGSVLLVVAVAKTPEDSQPSISGIACNQQIALDQFRKLLDSYNRVVCE